jgi:threonyl-tRNA synthetase
MLVIGAKEVEAQNITFRSRDTGESTTMALDEFIAKVQQETKDRV